MAIFLLFSLISGVVEFGCGMMLFVKGFPAPFAILACVSYQLGNIVPEIRRSDSAAGLSLLAAALGTASALTDGSYCAWLVCVYSALASVSIQSARASFKAKCNTTAKRIFRVFGFVLAFLPSLTDWVLPIAMLPVFIGCLLNSDRSVWNKKQQRVSALIGATMVFHQMHYFVYTYAMPLVICGFFVRIGIGDRLSVFLTSVLLGVTWVVYILPGYLISKKRSADNVSIFFICHSFLSAVLATLSAALMLEILPLIIAMWLLTGLGGGSVGCIGKLSERRSTVSLVSAENIGHIAGSVVSLAVVCAMGIKGAWLLAVLATAFAAAAIMCAAIERRITNDKLPEF